MLLLCLLIPILSICIWGPLVEIIYKEREKTTEGVVGFLNKICEMEFEKYISSSYETLANVC